MIYMNKKTKIVYSSGKITLRETIIRSITGKQSKWLMLNLGCDAVVVLLENKKKEILLIKQKRVGLNNLEYELPSGGIKKNESPLQAAQRELLEETGAKAKLFYKGYFYPLAGLVDLKVHVYKGALLEQSKDSLSPEDYEKISFEWISKAKLQSYIKNGLITDGYLFATLYLIGVKK